MEKNSDNGPNFEFRQSFHRLVESLKPIKNYYPETFNDALLIQIYNKLAVEDENGDKIRYEKVGVNYLLKFVSVGCNTLIRIMIIRTNKDQQDEAISKMTKFQKGYFFECKRKVFDATQFNRGCVLFLKKACIPVENAVGFFMDLPIENRVLGINHINGIVAIKPYDINNVLEGVLRALYECHMGDDEQSGHDIASMKKVSDLYDINCKLLDKIRREFSGMDESVSVGILNAFGVEVVSIGDVFKLNK